MSRVSWMVDRFEICIKQRGSSNQFKILWIAYFRKERRKTENNFFRTLRIINALQKPLSVTKTSIMSNSIIQVNKEKFIKCLKVVVRNELMTYTTPILLYLWMKKFGMNVGGPLPSIFRVIFDIIIFGVVDEVVFYYSHR